MALLDDIKAKAKAQRRHILLPEGTEERTIRAAERITREGLADVTLFGKESEIRQIAEKLGVSVCGIATIDPETHPDYPRYTETFYQMRKEKGVTPEKAAQTMKDPLFFAAMMIKDKKADGYVAGALCTTGATLRPGLQIVKMQKGISVVSSCFLMDIPNKSFGDNGLMLFGDCAVNPNPDAAQLAAIAVSTAQTARMLYGMEPRVAMLSFSTKGSAKHELVDKVAEATRLAHELDPELMLDGELQADAALIEKVGQLKCPGSPVAGKANILIFPDLQAANIGYKLVQRMAGAEAVGPICQGFAAPINDLSRGCSVEDIVSVVAITAVQAQAMNA